MTPEPYIVHARTLPRPSQAQVVAFVEHVTRARSWYKDLPLLPPGARFHFFLDPNAGRELYFTDQRVYEYRDRLESPPANETFHATWQPTGTYRERFGFLEFLGPADAPCYLPAELGVLDTESPARIQLPGGDWVDLPGGILEVSEVRLTACINPHARMRKLWAARAQPEDVSSPAADQLLADHSPGAAVARSIIELMRRLFERASGSGMSEMEWIFQPEWKVLERQLSAYAAEQRGEMKAAIERMLHAVYDAGC